MQHHAIDGRAWHQQANDSREAADHLIRLYGELGRLELSIRSDADVSVYGVNEDGELVYLAGGRIVEFARDLVGFAGINVTALAPFSYKALWTPRGEKIDPRTLTVEDRLTAADAQRLAMREELKVLLGRSGLIAQAGIDVDELVEDLDEELDFAEADSEDLEYEFGPGFMVGGLEPNVGGAEEPPPPPASSPEPSDDPSATPLLGKKRKASAPLPSPGEDDPDPDPALLST